MIVKTKLVKPKEFVGAKILKAKIVKHDPNCDSKNVLVLTTNKGVFEIEGTYGGYTGKSCDEYIEVINLSKIVK